MKNIQYYKNLKKKNITTGSKVCDNKNVTDEPILLIDMMNQLLELEQEIMKYNLEEGINWYIGFYSYIRDKKSKIISQYQTDRYAVGEIIWIEFFGHFGNEMTYIHPAYVIKNFKDDLIIAPISSSCYEDDIDTHVSIEKGIKTLGNMSNNCGIKTEQIRYISKKRIISKIGKITDANKLYEIGEKLMKCITPFNSSLLKKEIESLNNDLLTKSSELEEVLNEIVTYQERNNELEEELQKLKEILSKTTI